MSFEIGVSYTAFPRSTYETVLTGTLESSWGHGCNVTVQTFDLPTPREEQYVRFRATSYHGNGAGLQFMGFGPCEML